MLRFRAVLALSLLMSAFSAASAEARTIRIGALCIEGLDTNEVSTDGIGLTGIRGGSIRYEKKPGESRVKFFMFGPPTRFAPAADSYSWKVENRDNLIFELYPPPAGLGPDRFRVQPDLNKIFKDMRSRVASTRALRCVEDGVGGRPVLMTGTVESIAAAGTYSGVDIAEGEEFRFSPGGFRMSVATLDPIDAGNGVSKPPITAEQIDELAKKLEIPNLFEKMQGVTPVSPDESRLLSGETTIPALPLAELMSFPDTPAGPLSPGDVVARLKDLPLGADWTLSPNRLLTITNLDPTWSVDGGNSLMRVSLEATGLILSGIYLGEHPSAQLGKFTGLDDKPANAIFDLASSKFQSISGEFSTATRAVEDVAFHNLKTTISGAQIEAEAIGLKLNGDTATLTFEAPQIRAEAFSAPELNTAAIELTAAARSLQLTSTIAGSFRPAAAVWRELSGSSPALSLRFGDSPIIGIGNFTAGELSDEVVSNAKLDVVIDRAGDFSYLVGPLEGHTLSLSADGPANAPAFRISIAEVPLTLGDKQLSVGQTVSVAELEWDPVTGGLPFDFELRPSEVKATLVGSSEITLTGRVLGGRLTGVLSMENGKPELNFANNGLHLALGAAVAAGPWVAGSTPQFVDLKVELSTPDGLRIATDGLEGNLKLSAGLVTLLDPSIQIATGLPSLKMRLPLSSDAGVDLAMSLPSGNVSATKGYFRSGPVEAFSDEGTTVDFGDLAAQGVHLKADEISLSFEADHAVAKLSNVKLDADVIEFGGRAGTRSADHQTYILARPGDVLSVRSISAAATDLGNEKIAMGVTEVEVLEMTTGTLSMQSSDGFAYTGDGARLSIARLDEANVDADLIIGKGTLKLASDTAGMGSLQTSSMSAHVGGDIRSPEGELRFDIQDIDFTAPIALKIVDDCDVNHSDGSIRFGATLKVPSFSILARLTPDGKVSGAAALSEPTVYVALSRGFNCSFTKYISLRIATKVGYRVETPLGDIKDEKELVLWDGGMTMTFIAILDAFRLGYGFQDVSATLTDGKVQFCASGPHVVEPPRTLLSVSAIPLASDFEWATHFLVEATARISEPFQSAFATATQTVLVAWPELAAALPGGWRTCS